MPFDFLQKYFAECRIDCFSAISLKDCKIQKPYLLERAGITDGTVVMMAIPYFTHGADGKHNLSAYAIPKNYHLFFEHLFDSLIPLLKKEFPQYQFAGFSDHSPIWETGAAVSAGLGVLGKNGLLLTEKYSSFVFLGELITDAILPVNAREIVTCENCGACKQACPMEKIGSCLSALTQKKGTLSDEEKKSIKEYGSVWGCDICQTVCPHTQNALKNGTIFSPIPFFSENNIPILTEEILDGMDEEIFLTRAYSWRGKEPIARNLKILKDTEGNDRC